MTWGKQTFTVLRDWMKDCNYNGRRRPIRTLQLAKINRYNETDIYEFTDFDYKLWGKNQLQRGDTVTLLDTEVTFRVHNGYQYKNIHCTKIVTPKATEEVTEEVAENVTKPATKKRARKTVRKPSYPQS